MIYTWRVLGPTAALLVSTTVLVIILNRILPTEGFVGPDFKYFIPYLLAGVQWIHLNGWGAVPYFTTDFCGGIPWLANPQSIFYSVPQILALFMPFVTAIKLTAVIFATIGAVATYALLRQCFRTSWQAAALGSTLFQLNGFLIFRIGIGHLTYHVFGLVPLIAWCVLYFSEDNIKGNVRTLNWLSGIVIIGFLLSLMAFGGALNYIIPALLSVSAVILLQQAITGWSREPWITLGGGAIWSLFLSALKLTPAFVFASDYPRAYLHNYLFTNPFRMISYLFRSLFVPETLSSWIGMGHGGTLGLHELEFGVSVIPALLIAAAFLSHARQMTRPQHPFIFLTLGLIFAIPLVTTVGPEAWGRLLERVPIINNNTMLTRWYSIYIVPVVVLAALSFDRIVHYSQTFILAVFILLASLQLLGRDLTYYTTNKAWSLYNPAPVAAEAKRILSGGPPRPITEIGPPPAIRNASLRLGLWAPDTQMMNALLWGRSALPCYEPLFGYRLEMFPARQLRPGPITDLVAGNLIQHRRPEMLFDAEFVPAGTIIQI